jgi:hypothetical protein
MAINDHDIQDDATEALNELLREVEGGRAVDSELRASCARLWGRCTSGSLLLGLAERLSARLDFLLAAAACARDALAARTFPLPVLEEAIEVAEACARGAATPEQAKVAAGRAWDHVSRLVAGVDDGVGMAVVEACDLAAGDRFDYGGPDPAFRSAGVWAERRQGAPGTAAFQQAFREHQVVLAGVVRRVIPSP